MNNQFTIAITRYEYVNMYHTMTEIYNAFLIMEFFNQTQSSTNILIVDGHPSGTLDDVWKTLFNSSEEPNLSRCSRQVLAGPTAHDGWLPVKVTCRLSKLKESKVVSSYRDHCQLFVPASSSLDKLPEKKDKHLPTANLN